MSRNRSKHLNSLHVLPVLKWVLVIGLLAVLGMAYLLYTNQIKRVADDNKTLERQLRKIEERNTMLRLAIARLKSPRELQQRIGGMGLVSISELQRVRMDDISTTTAPARMISFQATPRLRDPGAPPGQP